MKLIPLTQGEFAKVDDADFDWLSAHKWTLMRHRRTNYAVRYVTARGKRQTIYMHREIMGLDGPEVDHRNRNGLDNQRHNLRLATTSQNLRNRRSPARELPRGVYPGRRAGTFKAQIKREGRCRHLGIFDTIEEAALAYAAVTAGDEFACAEVL